MLVHPRLQIILSRVVDNLQILEVCIGERLDRERECAVHRLTGRVRGLEVAVCEHHLTQILHSAHSHTHDADTGRLTDEVFDGMKHGRGGEVDHS